jgi:hypothetical protein
MESRLTHAADSVRIRARLDVFARFGAGALTEGITSNRRFDNGPLLRQTFRTRRGFLPSFLVRGANAIQRCTRWSLGEESRRS